MALIKCPECGKEISNKAESCPNCGYQLKNKDIRQKYNDKENVIKSGIILCIIGSSLLIGFILIILLSMTMPTTSNMSNANMTINENELKITIGEEGEAINSTISTVYLIGIVIVDFIILILGIIGIKDLIPHRRIFLFGLAMLLLSIILSAMMIMVLNCCFLFLFVTPICCFIGSIKIILGAIKEKRNEQNI